VIDDYGHHPAEIRATLEAARICKFNRLLVLFQPHRYTARSISGMNSPALSTKPIFGDYRYLRGQRAANPA